MRLVQESGCVGQCVNVCKIPTQLFFNQHFGVPLTMKPDFEDLSCKMVGRFLLPISLYVVSLLSSESNETFARE